MGLLDQAVALAQSADTAVDIASVRHYRTRLGASLSLEQELAAGIGLFVRAGKDAGNVEAYEFTRHRPDGERGLARSRARAGAARTIPSVLRASSTASPPSASAISTPGASASSSATASFRTRDRRRSSRPTIRSRCCVTPTSRSTTNSSPIRRITKTAGPYRCSPCACMHSIEARAAPTIAPNKGDIRELSFRIQRICDEGQCGRSGGRRDHRCRVWQNRLLPGRRHVHAGARQVDRRRELLGSGGRIGEGSDRQGRTHQVWCVHSDHIRFHHHRVRVVLHHQVPQPVEETARCRKRRRRRRRRRPKCCWKRSATCSPSAPDRSRVSAVGYVRGLPAVQREEPREDDECEGRGAGADLQARRAAPRHAACASRSNRAPSPTRNRAHGRGHPRARLPRPGARAGKGPRTAGPIDI